MSAPWYAVSDPRPDAAWELYHENSKRSPHDGVPLRGSPAPGPDYAGLPTLALADPAPPDGLKPSATGVPVISFASMSALLATGLRPAEAPDAVSAYVAIESVEGLPRGLAWYDAAGHRLRLLGRSDIWQRLRKALDVPEILDRSAAMIMLAADLDRSTGAAGERGYRDALIATGRRLAALDASAASAALGIDVVRFYDREVDALLHLDGLSQSALAVVALAAARG